MFTAGLESNNAFEKYFKPSVVVAILGVIVPVGSNLRDEFGVWHQSIGGLFIGVIFAATSVSVGRSFAKLKVIESRRYDYFRGCSR